MIRFLLPSLVLSAATLLPQVWGQPADADRIAAETETSIERAFLRADAAALADAVKPLDAALAAEPDRPSLLYTRAFAWYADAQLHRGPRDQAARKSRFDAAVGLLERIKDAPWEAEAAALHGTILGALIATSDNPAEAGATLGPKAGQLLAHAAEAAPDSARVLVCRGQSLLFTPEEYGGNPAEGRRLLEQAVARFAAGGGSAPGPRWGHADALAWLGIARQRAGDLAAARAAWQQALAIEPGYAWVRAVLLPSLDKPPGAR